MHDQEFETEGLSVRGLSCRRGRRRVLHDLSLDCPAGAALIVRGPNGVGKSTLLRAVAGLVPTDAGAVHLGDLAATDPAWVERITYAGHAPALRPQLTVAENLTFWARMLGADVRAAKAAWEALGLSAAAQRAVQHCSAGQRRRAALARLLLRPTSLWLLDEPTTALDTDGVATVEEIIRRHLNRGGLALISTHTPLRIEDASDLVLSVPAQPKDLVW